MLVMLSFLSSLWFADVVFFFQNDVYQHVI